MAVAVIPVILGVVVPLILPYITKYLSKQGQHVDEGSIEKQIGAEMTKRLTRLSPFELNQIMKYIQKLKLEGIPTYDWMQHLISRFPHFSDAIVAIVSGVNAQDIVKVKIGKRFVEPEKSEQQIAFSKGETSQYEVVKQNLMDMLEKAHSDENDAVQFYTKIINAAEKDQTAEGNIIKDKFMEIRNDEMNHRKIIQALFDIMTTKQETLK